MTAWENLPSRMRPCVADRPRPWLAEDSLCAIPRMTAIQERFRHGELRQLARLLPDAVNSRNRRLVDGPFRPFASGYKDASGKVQVRGVVSPSTAIDCAGGSLRRGVPVRPQAPLLPQACV
jgi:hypothetical protein